MTPKEIMKMSPESRLALEARARVGDDEAVRDFVMVSAWRSIDGMKGISKKEKVKSFSNLFKSVRVEVEK